MSGQTPNAAAGELEVELDGSTFKLRPSHQALARIETRLGSFKALAERVAVRDLRISDFAIVIGECAREAGAKITDDQVAEAVVKRGLVEYTLEVSTVSLLPFAGLDQLPSMLQAATTKRARTRTKTPAT